MNKSIFDYRHYKPYIRLRLGGERKKTGMRAEAARAMSCQTAYLSQILNGTANLSLEQAHALGGFLNHDHDEQEYFWLLIQKERAGTKEFAAFIEDKLNLMIEARLTIKSR